MNIEAKVIDMLLALFGEDKGLKKEAIQPEKDFIKDLGFDSLDVMTFAMEIEEKFGISVPDDDVEGIKTVQDVYNYLHKRLD